MNAAAWFHTSSFHRHEPKTTKTPEIEKPQFVYDRWDAEARRFRTYRQWADGRVEEVTS